MSNFTERLRFEIDRVGVSELARKTGFARNSLYNWSEKGNIPLDKLFVLTQFGVDMNYVLYNERLAQNNEQLVNEEFGLIQVRADIEVSAGDGAIAGNDDKAK